jgi:hypothetical protein
MSFLVFLSHMSPLDGGGGGGAWNCGGGAGDCGGGGAAAIVSSKPLWPDVNAQRRTGMMKYTTKYFSQRSETHREKTLSAYSLPAGEKRHTREKTMPYTMPYTIPYRNKIGILSYHDGDHPYLDHGFSIVQYIPFCDIPLNTENKICIMQTCRTLHSSTRARASLAGLGSSTRVSRRPARAVTVKTNALADTNLFVNLLSSLTAGAAVTAVVTATGEDDVDTAIDKLTTVEGAAPLAAAFLIDAIAHSIPGLNLLLNLASEPAGAAAGVAYVFSLVLSAPSVDPSTLAPEGTVLDAKKAEDSRGFVRVPFTKIIPTALDVIDYENDSSSGKGWTIGEDGKPKLPINSVLIVVGVGCVILEAAAHAPVLSLLLPRVLSCAGWLAATGYVLDKTGVLKKM